MIEANPLATLTVDDFVPHLGQPFVVSTEGREVTLSLQTAEASRLIAQAVRQGFSLVFAGEASLPQGMHTVGHPTLGGLELFLVPVGPCPQGLQYEAIFN
jgi:hypothetical protein